jgi:hypothetical protein
MKYFTPERYLALQNADPVAMSAADAAWDAEVERYDAYLQGIIPEMPQSVRALLDGFFLHDSRVLIIGQRKNMLLISMQLDVPPKELLTITYTVAGSAEINKRSFYPPGGDHAPLWLYEEIELIHESEKSIFAHDILLSNGWVLRIPFSEVQLEVADPVFAHGTTSVGVNGANQSTTRARQA